MKHIILLCLLSMSGSCFAKAWYDMGSGIMTNKQYCKKMLLDNDGRQIICTKNNCKKGSDERNAIEQQWDYMIENCKRKLIL